MDIQRLDQVIDDGIEFIREQFERRGKWETLRANISDFQGKLNECDDSLDAITNAQIDSEDGIVALKAEIEGFFNDIKPIEEKIKAISDGQIENGVDAVTPLVNSLDGGTDAKNKIDALKTKTSASAVQTGAINIMVEYVKSKKIDEKVKALYGKLDDAKGDFVLAKKEYSKTQKSGEEARTYIKEIQAKGQEVTKNIASWRNTQGGIENALRELKKQLLEGLKLLQKEVNKKLLAKRKPVWDDIFNPAYAKVGDLTISTVDESGIKRQFDSAFSSSGFFSRFFDRDTTREAEKLKKKVYDKDIKIELHGFLDRLKAYAAEYTAWESDVKVLVAHLDRMVELATKAELRLDIMTTGQSSTLIDGIQTKINTVSTRLRSLSKFDVTLDIFDKFVNEEVDGDGPSVDELTVDFEGVETLKKIFNAYKFARDVVAIQNAILLIPELPSKCEEFANLVNGVLSRNELEWEKEIELFAFEAKIPVFSVGWISAVFTIGFSSSLSLGFKLGGEVHRFDTGNKVATVNLQEGTATISLEGSLGFGIDLLGLVDATLKGALTTSFGMENGAASVTLSHASGSKGVFILKGKCKGAFTIKVSLKCEIAVTFFIRRLVQSTTGFNLKASFTLGSATIYESKKNFAMEGFVPYDTDDIDFKNQARKAFEAIKGFTKDQSKVNQIKTLIESKFGTKNQVEAYVSTETLSDEELDAIVAKAKVITGAET